jgi:hypothetical protein
MSCPGLEEQIARYLGGDLTAAETVAVESHLRGCTDCAELAASFEEDRAWLRRRPAEVGRVDYVEMRRRIRAEVARPLPERQWWVGLAAAAVVLLTLMAAWEKRAPQSVAHAPAAGRSLAPAHTVAQALVPGSRGAEVRLTKRARSVNTEPTTDAFTLEAAIRMYQRLVPEPPAPEEVSDSPVEMRIATRDSSVTIILVQESNGDSR